MNEKIVTNVRLRLLVEQSNANLQFCWVILCDENVHTLELSEVIVEWRVVVKFVDL